MTDKEILEAFIQVHKCLLEITMTLTYQQDIPLQHKEDIREQVIQLEILINKTAEKNIKF